MIGILNRREMQHNFSEYFIAIFVDGIVTIGDLYAFFFEAKFHGHQPEQEVDIDPLPE